MTEGGPASTSRSERILDPSLVEGLDDLSTGELRSRRDDSRAELEYLSYLRRLIQVREDLFTAEIERRATGGAPQSAEERIRSVLEGGPRSQGRGEALSLGPSEEDMAEAERRAEAAAGVPLSATETASDDELRQAVDDLGAEERRVSSARASVIRVLDLLQDHLKQRYREDPSQIPTDL